jgi:hypothetical protein
MRNLAACGETRYATAIIPGQTTDQTSETVGVSTRYSRSVRGS